MKAKYGDYSPTQIAATKLSLRKSIFFLLLYVDPATKQDYLDIDVPGAFRNLQYKIAGMNELLQEPPELVETMSLLESALLELQSKCFDFVKYRKLILDAGAKIMEGGDHND